MYYDENYAKQLKGSSTKYDTFYDKRYKELFKSDEVFL